MICPLQYLNFSSLIDLGVAALPPPPAAPSRDARVADGVPAPSIFHRRTIAHHLRFDFILRLG